MSTTPADLLNSEPSAVAPADPDTSALVGSGQAAAEDLGAVVDTPPGEGLEELLVGTMPAVDEAALDAAAEPDSATATPEAPSGWSQGVKIKGVTDSKGELPDRATHQTEEDGSWKLTRAGFIKRKTGGAALKGDQSTVTPKPKAAGPTPGPAPDISTAQEMEARLDMAAKGAMNVCAVASMMYYGPEDGELRRSGGTDEPAEWYTAWKDYFRAKGVYDFPPAIALAMVALAHVSRRFNTEGHKKRAVGFKERVKGWWIRRREAKAAARARSEMQAMHDAEKAESERE